MQRKRTGVILSRRQALGALAGGTGLLAAPGILRAQSPLTVRFVQQRGLLYIPVDIMVSGGILQQEATKLGLGKIEATATALSGPGPILDALLSGAADYGTAALPSLLTLWEKTRGTANEVKAVGTVSNGAITHSLVARPFSAKYSRSRFNARFTSFCAASSVMPRAPPTSRRLFPSKKRSNTASCSASLNFAIPASSSPSIPSQTDRPSASGMASLA